MRGNRENNLNLDQNVDNIVENKNISLVFIFWLKVIFGIIAGFSHYIIQRTLFYLGGFGINYLFRGFLIVGVFILLILSVQSVIILILYVSKNKSTKLVPKNKIVWRFSLRFSLTFIIIFLISTSIALHIGI
jgi:hypothetical protein